MKKLVHTIKLLTPAISVFGLMAATSFNQALAQGSAGPNPAGSGGSAGPNPAGNGGGSATPNPAGPGALQNPLNNINGVEDLLVAILEVLIIIAVPIIVIFIILAGFKYVTARGNAQQIQEASRALTYAIIGAVLVVGALAIAEIIKNLVAAF